MEKSPLGAWASASLSPTPCSSLTLRVEEPGRTNMGKGPRKGANEEWNNHDGRKKGIRERGAEPGKASRS